MAKKNVLGKGLGALIPQKKNEVQENLDSQGVQELLISKIKPNKLQPRVIFEQDKLDELCQSIKEHGVIQPISVREDGNEYKIIFGERRYRAAKSLGLEKIPAIVMKADDEKSHIIALIENIQRENLNAIEEGEAYRRLIKEYNFTQDEVAEKVGKNRTTVANSIRLLKLPSEIQNFLIEKKLSMGHIRCLLSIEDLPEQLTLAQKAVQEDLSVRELELLVSEKNKKEEDKPQPKTKEKNTKAFYDPDLSRFMEKLQYKFSCKVNLNGNLEKGKIFFEYHNKDDLHRILETFGVLEEEF